MSFWIVGYLVVKANMATFPLRWLAEWPKLLLYMDTYCCFAENKDGCQTRVIRTQQIGSIIKKKKHNPLISFHSGVLKMECKQYIIGQRHEQSWMLVCRAIFVHLSLPRPGCRLRPRAPLCRLIRQAADKIGYWVSLRGVLRGYVVSLNREGGVFVDLYESRRELLKLSFVLFSTLMLIWGTFRRLPPHEKHSPIEFRACPLTISVLSMFMVALTPVCRSEQKQLLQPRFLSVVITN